MISLASPYFSELYIHLAHDAGQNPTPYITRMDWVCLQSVDKGLTHGT